MYKSNSKIELLIKETETEICSYCSPTSLIPHEMKKTKLRIANLCCSGEERIIRNILDDINGIEEVSINIIGRYAVIKHCNIKCCAPAEKIVNLLNDKKLGASIQEANIYEDEQKDSPEYANIIHGIIVILLFIISIIIDMTNSYESHTISYLACTTIGLIPILYDACLSLYRLSIDIHILMIVAVAGAISSQEYLDAALVVTLFILAELIESEVMRRVRNAVKLGVGGMPKTAILLNGDSIFVDDLKINDIIAVRAGDMILADGEVISGVGIVDESALTGEAIPIQKTKGDKVISGTVVQNGYLEIKVEIDPRESTVRKLNEKVTEVQTDRGKFAKLVDQFASIWTPFILLAAVALTCIAGGTTGDWHKWSHRSLVLLVLACPCAIVIAAPIPSVCTIATAAKHGVLIKGSSVVENLGVVDKLATDKTGTLTKGYFSVTSSILIPDLYDGNNNNNGNNYNNDEIDPIQLAAALESRSAHPLANAIVSYYCGCIADFEGTLPNVKKVQVIDGVGMQGWVFVNEDWKHISVGNERLLKSNGGKINPSKKCQEIIEKFQIQRKGELILFICIEDELKALMSLSDELRPDAIDMVSRMHKMDFDVVMLTGDHWDVAKNICQAVAIPQSRCHARLLPDEKLGWIHKAQTGGNDHVNLNGGVIMLGDGINDATALASARVGVAMGAGGSAMAVVAADVVILSNNLLRLPSAVSICRKARRIIISNCIFAVGLKMIAISLAILGMLSLWQAVLIDVGSLLIVVGNGSSLLWSHSFRDSDVPEIGQKIEFETKKERVYEPPQFFTFKTDNSSSQQTKYHQHDHSLIHQDDHNSDDCDDCHDCHDCHTHDHDHSHSHEHDHHHSHEHDHHHSHEHDHHHDHHDHHSHHSHDHNHSHDHDHDDDHESYNPLIDHA